MTDHDDTATFLRRVRRTRRIVMAVSFGFIPAFAGLATVGYFFLPRYPNGVQSGCILNGAPQFITLALIIAIAAYLRSIHGNALETRNAIRQGKVAHYPMDGFGSDVSKRKMLLLDGVVNDMSIAGSIFINLSVVVGFRILCAAILPWMGIGTDKIRILAVMDMLIVGCIAISFLALAFAHFRARQKDEEIRIEARQSENTILEVSARKIVTSADSAKTTQE